MENPSSIWDSEYSTETSIPSSTRDAPSKALEMLLPAFPDEANSIVEIGCGNGRNLSLLASWYSDAMVTGVDFSEIAVRRAQSRMNEKPYDVKIREEDALSWLNERPNNSVDLVVDSYFSQHLIDEDILNKYLKSVESVVPSGGFVYWSAVGKTDEYYSKETKSIGENLIKDSKNNVQKRLYTEDKAWDLLGDKFETVSLTTVRFYDSVDESRYKRTVHAGCFRHK